MAMFASARLALRRSLAAPPRASSLGASLRQATVEPSQRLHGPRLFNSDASASFENSPKTNKEMEYKRRLEAKRTELIESLVQALDTCDPAQRDRIREKYKAAKQASEEYRAERQKNHNSNNGSQKSKTADGEKPMSFGSFLSITVGSILLGVTLSDLETKWRGRA
ncbi:unnamed protein product [Urochloa decumbens]|uniref:Uncharacterized protein n=1 Tax=Urochloa decumbens TaxID=240449 RepID=A0ABC9GML2_9POAL